MDADLWNQAKGKWAALARRERYLAVLVLMLALGSLVDLVVVEPMVSAIKIERTDLAAKQKELDGYVKQKKDIAAEVDALGIKPVAASNSSEAQRKALAKGQLWDAEAANLWFNQTVATFGPELAQLSIATLGQPHADMKSLFSHEVAMQVTSSWEKSQRFLQAMGAAPALSIDALDMSSDANGRIVLTLKARALSADQEWMPAHPITLKGSP